MTTRYFNSIRAKIVTVVVAVSTLALLLASSAFVVNQYHMARDAKMKRVSAVAELLGYNSSAALSFGEAEVASDLLAALENEPTVRFACLLDEEGESFATYHTDGAVDPGSIDPGLLPQIGQTYSYSSLEVMLPIVESSDTIGSIYIEATLDDLYNQLASNLAAVGMVIVVSMGVAFVLAMRLQSVISRPILNLAETTRAVSAQGDYSIRVHSDSQDEIGVLYQGFNRMLEQVQQAESELRDAHDTLEHRVATRTEELAKERVLLHTIIESIPQGLFWKDQDLNYSGCNSVFADLMGIEDSESIVGASDRDFPMLAPSASTNADSERSIIDTGEELLNEELEVSTESGDKRFLWVSKTPLTDPSGEAVGVVGLFADVTEQKRVERELTQAQRLESIGQLAAGIAHEINTPMQCVAGNVEFLTQGQEKLLELIECLVEMINGDAMPWEERKEEAEKAIKKTRYQMIAAESPGALQQTADASRRVVEIVRSMRAMSHPGTSAKTQVEINEIIRNAATISTNRWKYHADLELELDESAAPIEGYSTELSQVIINLIVNAADAIAEKSDKKGVITVRSTQDAQHTRIEVQDTGCGMPKKVQARVFDPFFTTKDVGKGTGQGLSLTYDVIVNNHQGTIDIATTEGEGTTFFLCIPNVCKEAAEQALASATPDESEAEL